MRQSSFDRIARSILGAALLVSISFPVMSMAADATRLSDYASAEDPPLFDTPEQAIEALKSTLDTGDFDKLAVLLGLNAAKVKTSEGVMETYADIKAGAKEKVLVKDVDGRKVVEIGDELWPLPFPVAKGDDGKWAFDTYTGLEEIANRHAGENEIQTIATMRAYVDAQEDYASQDRDGDAVLEYAQTLISSEGQQDGLYWPADQGGESPAGEALASGAVLAKAKAGEGYFGYHYRILASQGDNIAGGRFDYIINGNMIAGFGLVAWPADYGVSGVKTFVVNRNGIVYEADLGTQTAKVASGIRQFNPNDDWQVVKD